MNWMNNSHIKMIDFALTSKIRSFSFKWSVEGGVDKVMNIMEIPFIVDVKTMSNQKKKQ
jgi:hypothetical protein